MFWVPRVYLLPQKKESEDSHHRVESVGSAEVFHLEGAVYQIGISLFGSSVRKIKTANRQERTYHSLGELWLFWRATMIIGQPTQTSKQAFKQRIKCENQGKSRKIVVLKKLTPGCTLAALKRLHSSLCIGASLHSALVQEIDWLNLVVGVFFSEPDPNIITRKWAGKYYH